MDNLSRRKIDVSVPHAPMPPKLPLSVDVPQVELGCSSLTPIASMEERVSTWNAVSGKQIRFVYLDLAKEYDRFVQARRTSGSRDYSEPLNRRFSCSDHS